MPVGVRRQAILYLFVSNKGVRRAQQIDDTFSCQTKNARATCQGRGGSLTEANPWVGSFVYRMGGGCDGGAWLDPPPTAEPRLAFRQVRER